MQISTKPQDAKKLIDASIPKNASQKELADLHAEWNRKAAERTEAIRKETRVPTLARATFRYKLEAFGKHWQAYAKANVKTTSAYVPLLNAPSLLSSAIDALTDRMESDGLNA